MGRRRNKRALAASTPVLLKSQPLRHRVIQRQWQSHTQTFGKAISGTFVEMTLTERVSPSEILCLSY